MGMVPTEETAHPSVQQVWKTTTPSPWGMAQLQLQGSSPGRFASTSSECLSSTRHPSASLLGRSERLAVARDFVFNTYDFYI